MKDILKPENLNCIKGCVRSMLMVFFMFLYFFLLPGCTSHRETIYRKSMILMDTLITVTVVSGSQEHAAKAMDAAFAGIEKLENLLDFYSPVSEISVINRNAGISYVNVSPDTFKVIEKALFVSEQTMGAFDISIGPVTSLYDFHKKVKPNEQIIKKNLQLVNYRDIIINKKKSAVFLKRKGMLIDPGGISKGYTADRAVEILKGEGISSGIVSVAGDIRAFGLRPDGKPWKVGIRNPLAGTGEDDIMATLDLRDSAISTSGDYERFFITGGKRYHHLLNPKTGHSAQECRSVSIITGEGAFTDAFATGIFVLGPEKGLQVLGQMGFGGVIVDSYGKIHLTPDLRGKVAFKDTP
jgi:thiamine biosynthesis lipoprotein